MFQVWDGDLFLFTCEADEVDAYKSEGFSVKRNVKD
jgi:hypothetical protein